MKTTTSVGIVPADEPSPHLRVHSEDGESAPQHEAARYSDSRIEFFRELMRSACEITFAHRDPRLEQWGRLFGPLAKECKRLIASGRDSDLDLAIRMFVVLFREQTELRRIELEAVTALIQSFVKHEIARAQAVGR